TRYERNFSIGVGGKRASGPSRVISPIAIDRFVGELAASPRREAFRIASARTATAPTARTSQSMPPVGRIVWTRINADNHGAFLISLVSIHPAKTRQSQHS